MSSPEQEYGILVYIDGIRALDRSADAIKYETMIVFADRKASYSFYRLVFIYYLTAKHR